MQAIIVFNLQEEDSEFKMHMKASEYYLSIADFLEYMRSKLKYEELPQEQQACFERIREKLLEILDDRGLTNDFL